jgi:hypothetical protein
VDHLFGPEAHSAVGCFAGTLRLPFLMIFTARCRSITLPLIAIGLAAFRSASLMKKLNHCEYLTAASNFQQL